MSNHQRVAVVTGAGTGIGRASSAALAGAGYDVILAGRRMEPLDRTRADVEAAGRRALCVPTDVSQADQVDALFDLVEEEFGRVDVLFNNAGMGSAPVPMDELATETWDRVVGANLTGSFLCARRAMGLMKSQDPHGGRIINNGSISAHTPRPNSAPYTSTKHAITGLTKSISLDGRAHDINCSQIDIGNAGTEMTSRMGDGAPQADGSVRPEPTFDVRHVSDAVLYIAGLPLDTNVLFMTVMANQMPFVGRG
ncbi:MAG: SDR family NAD(P)-dependent oxidoreductase [Actinomycetota bacterium]|jgi:NAD(P)-dependent dehydrogenase (short-subunit alcohol dehydrogenase family)|nr:SDR family NAD(P)-dependent oxidoreductase [Actinomycetota bacterium]